MTNENTPNFSPSYEELLIYSLWAAIKNVIPIVKPNTEVKQLICFFDNS